ncbi:hypothetical protein [Acinetobacter radioresistens]|jgi:hypothetical protein|uniref:hypothetical protein n=1 Tax=Acinetobacter radioresistens TaxID=40216 RepID=UPI0032124E39
MTPELHQEVQDFYLHAMALTRFAFSLSKKGSFYTLVLAGEQPEVNEKIRNLQGNGLVIKYDKGSTLYFVYEVQDDIEKLIKLPKLSDSQIEFKLQEILKRYR